MVSIQGGRLVPIRFDDLREPETGKTRVRLVDTAAEGYRVARAYMIRLEAEDFEHAAWVDKLAEAAHLTPGEFRQRFEHLANGVAASRTSGATVRRPWQSNASASWWAAVRPRDQRRHQRRGDRGHQASAPSRSASTTASSGWRSATPTSSTS